MAPLFVLVGSFVLLRGAGALGVTGLSSSRAACRSASAAMSLFTGATHFSPMKHDYVAMAPAPLPKGLGPIYVVGALQIAGAAGLLIEQTRRPAGFALALLLFAMFPANINAARKGIPFRGKPPTPLWLRTPIQLLFVAAVLWGSRVSPAPTRKRVQELLGAVPRLRVWIVAVDHRSRLSPGFRTATAAGSSAS